MEYLERQRLSGGDKYSNLGLRMELSWPMILKAHLGLVRRFGTIDYTV